MQIASDPAGGIAPGAPCLGGKCVCHGPTVGPIIEFV